jgi:hypothetical protein
MKVNYPEHKLRPETSAETRYWQQVMAGKPTRPQAGSNVVVVARDGSRTATGTITRFNESRTYAYVQPHDGGRVIRTAVSAIRLDN